MNTQIKSQNKLIYSAYDNHISCNIYTPHGEDKTKQSFADECDINCIMSRYNKTGVIESGNLIQPHYGDASAFDFQEAQDTIIIANNMFDSLPAKIRAQFENDPYTFLSWMDNPANQAEAIKMGLLPTPSTSSEASLPLDAKEALSHNKTSTKGDVAPILDKNIEKP